MIVRTLLGISLAANIGLAGAVGWLRWKLPVSATASPPRPGIEAGHSAGRGAATSPAVHTLLIEEAAPRFHWTMLESSDDIQFVAALRSVECPAETIRDIVSARVKRRYQVRLRQEVEPLYRDFRYWQNDHGITVLRSEDSRLRLLAEANQLLRALLGERFEDSDGRGEGDSQGFLPPEKRQQVEEIRMRHARQDLQLQMQRATAAWDESWAAQDRATADARRIELAQLMTPEELAQFNLRESPAVLFALDRFPAARSEAEFQAMVLIAQKHQPELDRLAFFDPDRDLEELARLRITAERAMWEELKALVGAQRLSTDFPAPIP